MSGVAIRLAEREDLTAVVGLHRDVHEIHRIAFPKLFKEVSEIEIREWFSQQISKPETRLWVADANPIVGYLLAFCRTRGDSPFTYTVSWLEVDQVFVSADYRLKGVGRRLFDQAFSFAQEQGIDQVELNTWAFNDTAQLAFEKLGFKPRLIRWSRTP